MRLRFVPAAAVACIAAAGLATGAGALTAPQRVVSALGAKPSLRTVESANNYIANGGFEGSLAGWGGYKATLSLAADGLGGGGAALVTFTGGDSSYSIVSGKRPVGSTVAGTTYTASASVRSARPGKSLCLRIRDYTSSGSVADYASRCVAATSGWAPVEVSYKAPSAGHSLDAFVYQTAAAAGDTFEVDELALADGTPSAPATTTTVPTTTTRPTSTTTTTTPAPAPAPTPAPAPSSAQTWLAPFLSTSVWSLPLPADPALDPNSAAKIAYLVANARNPNFAIHGWTTTIAVADPSSPRYTVPCTTYKCTLGSLGPIPIPRGTLPDPQGDGHLAVWDPITHIEWDFWQPKYDAANDRWTAAAGAAASTDTNALAPAGTAGADAANIPLLAGLVRPEEIAAGRIDHALMFAMPGVATGAPKCPATHSAGSVTRADAMTEGTRIQLDPSFDVASLAVPAWEKTILRAAQRYGIFLRDQGGALTVLGENPLNRGYDAWAQVGVVSSGGSIALKSVPWDRFRVIDAPDC